MSTRVDECEDKKVQNDLKKTDRDNFIKKKKPKTDKSKCLTNSKKAKMKNDVIELWLCYGFFSALTRSSAHGKNLNGREREFFCNVKTLKSLRTRECSKIL